MVTGPGRPGKACNVCKKQKIRCSGERPSCKRCARLKSTCHYDIRNRLDRPLKSGAGAPSKRSKLTSTLPNPSVPTTPPAAGDGDSYAGIPPSLVSNLVELYFTNVYQSDLLLHRDSFLQSIENHTVRPHVLLSVCAWGANFYRDDSGRASLKEEGLMTKWAKKAGALVFQDVEELQEDNIVTFCNLSLFWHSQGSWRVSYLHKGNACQLFHIIGIGLQTSSRHSELASEIHRRRFWACYLFHCFSSEKLFRFEAITEFEKLPLPWPDKCFTSGISPSAVATISNGLTAGVFAEIIRGLTSWGSVVLVVRSKEDDFSSRLQQIFKLENEISSWWQHVPQNFKLDPSRIPTVDRQELPRVLLVNLIYHQSLCALHSSVVPLFCWSKGDVTYSSARQLSAQIAYENSCTVSSLINAVLATNCPVSTMAIFVAYAAYSSCAVQIPFLWCTEQSVKERARNNVEANISMIQHMSDYWKLASLLQVYARCLYNMHKRNPPNISNEPRYTDGSVFNNFGAGLSTAKSSILEFNGVLRSDEHGYIKPGEESQDLTSPQETVATAVQQDGDEIPGSHHGQELGQSFPILPSEYLSSSVGGCNLNEPHSQFDLGASEWPTLDRFNSLLDTDMTGFFPTGDTMDFPFSTTDMLSWDMSDLIGNQEVHH